MLDKTLTRILDFPNYRVASGACTFDEETKTLRLRVNPRGIRPVHFCGTCGNGTTDTYGEPEPCTLRDLPCIEWKVLVQVDKYRIRCWSCGKVKTERLSFAEVRSHFTTRFEAMVASDCRAMPNSEVAKRHGLHWETVKRIDKKYLRRWAELRRRRPLRVIGVDEKAHKKGHNYLTIVSDLERGEVVWVGRGRDEAILDTFFVVHLGKRRCRTIRTACIDMGRPYANSIRKHCPHAAIVYDKFHVLRQVNDAVDEVRRAEFFRLGGKRRGLIKGKRWLFLRRWANLDWDARRSMNDLFLVNRRLSKAYWLKESLSHLWDFRYRFRMIRFLFHWIRELRWQRLRPFWRVARMLLDHLEGILNYCHQKVTFGLVEAINRTIDDLLRRARGYRDLEYLRLKIMFASAHTENPL